MSHTAWLRRAILAVLALLGLLVVLLAGAAAWIANADVASLASRFASWEAGREVTVQSLRIDWRDGVAVELRGARVANAPWSEMKEMASVEAASAVLDPGALWRGLVRYETLRISGLRVVLERGPERVGNWEFGGPALPVPSGVAVPRDRSSFPTVLDGRLQDALITYRTSSGQILKIDLDEVTVRSPGDDQPVAIAAAGAYNDVAAKARGTGQSFDAVRDTSRPYGLDVAIETASGITTATFDGTLMQPLDFDGADGRLKITASDSAELGQIFNAAIGVTFPLEIVGHLTRAGDDWRLENAEGAVAGNSFAGGLHLVEGGPGEPDDVAADLDFPQLDLGPLLGDDAVPAGGLLETPIALGEAPGINLDLDLRSGAFVLGRTTLADARLVGHMEGRRITVDRLAFGMAGGGVTASGRSEPADGGSRVTLDAAIEGIDAADVAASFGAAPGDVSGRVDGRATLAMTGKTVADALHSSRGHAVIAMDEGRIAREILERASGDLRALFRDREGSARIHCVLGILDLTDGVGHVTLLKLRTADATLNGAGTVNLVKERVDLMFMTAPDSTGFFALDVPFRVHGPLDDPNVEAAFGAESVVGGSPRAAAELPAELKRLAENNACHG
jgi:AsmA family protein